MKKFFLNRLREASTWRAIIGFVTIFGVTMTPEQKETVAVAGAALICVVGAFFPDKKVTPVPTPAAPPAAKEPDALGDGEVIPQPRWDGKVNGSMM